MTDKAPVALKAIIHEQLYPAEIHVSPAVVRFHNGAESGNWETREHDQSKRYVPATALDAANARIADLEAEVSAWRQVQDAVAELEGHGPDWPSHGNAPLAVTAGYALHRQRAATARAEALEEAANVADERVSAWLEAEPPYGIDLDEAIELVSGLPEAIRALKGDKNA